MSEASRPFHAATDGEAWLLVRDAAADKVFVRHVPPAASGAQPRECGLGAFLSQPVEGDEHRALLRLIGQLVDRPPEEDAERIAQVLR